MSLAKFLLATLVALALTACGDDARPGAAPQGQALVAEMQPAGGQADALRGRAELKAAPQPLKGDALPVAPNP